MQDNHVDPRQEPSVAWGWHGGFPRGTRIAGWTTAALCFLLMYHTGGEGESETPNLFLALIAVLIIAGLLWDRHRRRTPWRH